MPSKSKRAASRQAQVRQRRRKGRGAPESFDTGPTESQRVDRIVAEEAYEQPRATTSRPVSAPVVSRQTPRRRNLGMEAAPAYDYLGGELKRIGVVAALIVGILIGATFTLGG